MFKNKHVITALIVTPILAIVGYFATDYYVSEQPQKALPGGQYELVQLPNCRYESGQCGLKNGNFKIIVTGNENDQGLLVLKIESEFPIDNARISIVESLDEEDSPVDMFMISDDSTVWQIALETEEAEKKHLRLVVAANDAFYYAETGLVFLNYQTSFGKDFR
jgi:hypothetical protein